MCDPDELLLEYIPIQNITVDVFYFQEGVAVHEILHTLGLWHEHQRPDRDDYITIHKDNIKQWSSPNFDISPDNTVHHTSFPYDYSSVMHYDNNVSPQ